MKLEQRLLGNTGIQVSRLSLGTVKIGRNTDVKYPSTFDLPGDEAVTELLETAHSLGINMIDTAPAYGISERRLGELMPLTRKDWLLCTKAGENYRDQRSSFDFSADGIRRSVHNSLSHLRTDYLDIVLLHSDGNDLQILNDTAAMATLAELKNQGMVRAIGMSTKTIEGGLAALASSDVVMVTYNPSETSERPVIKEALRTGKGVMIKKALASGHGNPAENLQFALSEPGVSTVVLGTINPKHLIENVALATR